MLTPAKLKKLKTLSDTGDIEANKILQSLNRIADDANKKINTESEKKRKADSHEKIILGGAIQAFTKKSNENKQALSKMLSTVVTRASDRDFLCQRGWELGGANNEKTTSDSSAI